MLAELCFRVMCDFRGVDLNIIYAILLVCCVFVFIYICIFNIIRGQNGVFCMTSVSRVVVIA